MLEQEIKDIWNNSSRTAQISIETKKLIDELNARVISIQKTVRIRDIREISASVIGIIIYGYLLYEIPFPISKIACILSIIWFVFVIYKSNKSRNQNTKSDLSLPIVNQLHQQETTLKQQVKFLYSAAYWYSGASFITNFVFILGLGNPQEYNWTNSIAESVLPLSISFKIITLIGLAFFYTFIVWINRRAATKGVKPILDKLALAISVVQEDTKKNNGLK